MTQKTKITVIDSIMGSGKTSWAIRKMNEDVLTNYIYITPFLTEVERIKESCKDKNFVEPKNNGSGKKDDFHKLLMEQRNISSTHALFGTSTDLTIDLIKSNNYSLILDEVMDVVELIKTKKDDVANMLKAELITIKDKVVYWNEDKADNQSQFDGYKHKILSGNVVFINGSMMLWNFPIDVFNAFNEVHIMTFLFDAQIQKYYYDLYELEYEYKSIGENYDMIDYSSTSKEYKLKIKNNLSILDDEHMNAIGDRKYSLSKSWFDSSNNKIGVKQLKNNVFNFFRNINKTKSHDVIWTTFKNSKDKLKGNGYTKGFISLNSRATNEYGDRHYMAYCTNRFMNPIISNYFNDRDVKVDEDKYALSELLQWVWRSAIRNDEKVHLYIPSNRMRLLLEEWLNK